MFRRSSSFSSTSSGTANDSSNSRPSSLRLSSIIASPMAGSRTKPSDFEYFGRETTDADFLKLELKERVNRATKNDTKPKLDLSGCNMNNDHILSLSIALAIAPMIAKLDLSNNPFTDEGASHILRLMEDQAKIVYRVPVDNRLNTTFLCKLALPKSISQSVLDKVAQLSEALEYANAQLFVRKCFLDLVGDISVVDKVTLGHAWSQVLGGKASDAQLTAMMRSYAKRARETSGEYTYLQYHEFEMALMHQLQEDGRLPALSLRQYTLINVSSPDSSYVAVPRKSTARIGENDSSSLSIGVTDNSSNAIQKSEKVAEVKTDMKALERELFGGASGDVTKHPREVNKQPTEKEEEEEDHRSSDEESEDREAVERANKAAAQARIDRLARVEEDRLAAEERLRKAEIAEEERMLAQTRLDEEGGGGGGGGGRRLGKHSGKTLVAKQEVAKDKSMMTAEKSTDPVIAPANGEINDNGENDDDGDDDDDDDDYDFDDKTPLKLGSGKTWELGAPGDSNASVPLDLFTKPQGPQAQTLSQTSRAPMPTKKPSVEEEDEDVDSFLKDLTERNEAKLKDDEAKAKAKARDLLAAKIKQENEEQMRLVELRAKQEDEEKRRLVELKLKQEADEERRLAAIRAKEEADEQARQAAAIFERAKRISEESKLVEEKKKEHERAAALRTSLLQEEREKARSADEKARQARLLEEKQLLDAEDEAEARRTQGQRQPNSHESDVEKEDVLISQGSHQADVNRQDEGSHLSVEASEFGKPSISSSKGMTGYSFWEKRSPSPGAAFLPKQRTRRRADDTSSSPHRSRSNTRNRTNTDSSSSSPSIGIAKMMSTTDDSSDTAINLSNEGLSTIPLEFKNCIPNKILFVNLSNNSITTITHSGIDMLSNLQYLDLSHNQISSITVMFPNSLVYLDLSHNRLKRVAGVLTCANLKELNISNNVMKQVEEIPSNLIRLNVNHNFLSTDLSLRMLALSPKMLSLCILGNPVVENLTNYRARLISLLPSLLELDEVLLPRKNSKADTLSQSLIFNTPSKTSNKQNTSPKKSREEQFAADADRLRKHKQKLVRLKQAAAAAEALRDTPPPAKHVLSEERIQKVTDRLFKLKPMHYRDPKKPGPVKMKPPDDSFNFKKVVKKVATVPSVASMEKPVDNQRNDEQRLPLPLKLDVPNEVLPPSSITVSPLTSASSSYFDTTQAHPQRTSMDKLETVLEKAFLENNLETVDTVEVRFASQRPRRYSDDDGDYDDEDDDEDNDNGYSELLSSWLKESSDRIEEASEAMRRLLVTVDNTCRKYLQQELERGVEIEVLAPDKDYLRVLDAEHIVSTTVNKLQNIQLPAELPTAVKSEEVVLDTLDTLFSFSSVLQEMKMAFQTHRRFPARLCRTVDKTISNSPGQFVSRYLRRSPIDSTTFHQDCNVEPNTETNETLSSPSRLTQERNTSYISPTSAGKVPILSARTSSQQSLPQKQELHDPPSLSQSFVNDTETGMQDSSDDDDDDDDNDDSDENDDDEDKDGSKSSSTRPEKGLGASFSVLDRLKDRIRGSAGVGEQPSSRVRDGSAATPQPFVQTNESDYHVSFISRLHTETSPVSLIYPQSQPQPQRNDVNHVTQSQPNNKIQSDIQQSRPQHYPQAAPALFPFVEPLEDDSITTTHLAGGGGGGGGGGGPDLPSDIMTNDATRAEVLAGLMARMQVLSVMTGGKLPLPSAQSQSASSCTPSSVNTTTVDIEGSVSSRPIYRGSGRDTPLLPVSNRNWLSEQMQGGGDDSFAPHLVQKSSNTDDPMNRLARRALDRTVSNGNQAAVDAAADENDDVFGNNFDSDISTSRIGAPPPLASVDVLSKVRRRLQEH